jgi:hypothetical protein
MRTSINAESAVLFYFQTWIPNIRRTLSDFSSLGYQYDEFRETTPITINTTLIQPTFA